MVGKYSKLLKPLNLEWLSWTIRYTPPTPHVCTPLRVAVRSPVGVRPQVKLSSLKLGHTDPVRTTCQVYRNNTQNIIIQDVIDH